ncbi:ATP-binding protein [Chitinimonas lacunae]|uniref:histidine kinase n=1 Tax=Chitinimonas lacunae TaxID=1963018 RepID=A0ABV8MQP7_9NEIS
MPDFRPTLVRVLWLRWITLSLHLGAAVLAIWGFGLVLPWPGLLLNAVALAVYGLATLVRLRLAPRFPVPAAEVGRQLAVDLVGHAVWLYFLGGATNPLTAWFLLPLAIAAASLPSRQVWLLTGLTVVAYSLLLTFYLPLPIPDAALAQAFYLHTLGMWLAFVGAALILAGLVARIGRQLREREAELAGAREAALRDQQLFGIALQAAGAAHRLGTPLATLTLLVDELRHEHAAQPTLKADLDLMAEQLAACRGELARLRADGDVPVPRPADQAVRELLDDWRLVRLQVQAELSLPPGAAPAVAWGFALRQALLNLLDNAADASPDWQGLQLDWAADRIVLAVEDAGPGFDGRVVERQGLGVGVALAVSAIERAGGRVAWLARPGGGTRVEVELPSREAR